MILMVYVRVLKLLRVHMMMVDFYILVIDKTPNRSYGQFIQHHNINGFITEKYNGEIKNIPRYDLTNIFSTEDRGYSVVTGNYIVGQDVAQWVVNANFITNDGQSRGEFEIYTLPQPNGSTITTFSLISCGIAFELYGYSCLLYQNSPTENIFTNLNFISTGAVIQTQNFQVSQLTFNTKLYDAINLFHGGYVIVVSEPNNDINGYAYSNDGIFNRSWALPTNYTYTSKIFGVSHDNTVWAVADENNAVVTNQWTSVFSTALKSFSTVKGDTGYGSSSILSTSPGINATIPSGTKQTIMINYTMNVGPSTGSIIISQKNPNGGDDFIRTRMPANNPNNPQFISIDGSTVKVSLEDYTFDRGNAAYIIKIDDDFVEANGQNLIGGSWDVFTVPDSGTNEQGKLF
ncbi:hypothetical protein C1645_557160 [Glomus cerebriforme]|uniref:Uncharacterized protein n=1 Tax=Glomus cerebriforme TaxID=658196 RepID=A0A397TM15_9GLOM|nr:hypothetical protein C1645_557160 [Glomus cerebriforme]